MARTDAFANEGFFIAIFMATPTSMRLYIDLLSTPFDENLKIGKQIPRNLGFEKAVRRSKVDITCRICPIKDIICLADCFFPDATLMP